MPAPFDDTPYVNDGADTSLRKAVSLLNKINAKPSAVLDGDISIGQVTIDSENQAPVPVSLPATSNSALSNISTKITNIESFSDDSHGFLQEINRTVVPTGDERGILASGIFNGSEYKPISVGQYGELKISGMGDDNYVPVYGSVNVNNEVDTNTFVRNSLDHPIPTQLVREGSPVDFISSGPAGTPSPNVLSVQGVGNGTPVSSKIVDGSNNPVSFISSGTAGSPSVNVLTVQGTSNLTGKPINARLVDGANTGISFIAAGVSNNPSPNVLSVQGAASLPNSSDPTNPYLPTPINVRTYHTISTVTTKTFSSLTSAQIKEANFSRVKTIIHCYPTNTVDLYVGIVSTEAVAANAYTWRIPPGQYLEITEWAGVIKGAFLGGTTNEKAMCTFIGG